MLALPINLKASRFGETRVKTMKARKGAGATAIEYGLIAALISVAIIAAVNVTTAPQDPAVQTTPKK